MAGSQCTPGLCLLTADIISTLCPPSFLYMGSEGGTLVFVFASPNARPVRLDPDLAIQF